MDDDLPSSGEPGARRPRAEDLRRPEMWPAGTGQQPFRGAEGDTAAPPSPARRRGAFVAVGVMAVGAVLVGLAVVRTSWLLAAVGVAVGLVGAVVAVKVRILQDVSVGDSPTGPATPGR